MCAEHQGMNFFRLNSSRHGIDQSEHIFDFPFFCYQPVKNVRTRQRERMRDMIVLFDQ